MVLIDVYLLWKTQSATTFLTRCFEILIQINEMFKKGRAGYGSAFCCFI